MNQRRTKHIHEHSDQQASTSPLLQNSTDLFEVSVVEYSHILMSVGNNVGARLVSTACSHEYGTGAWSICDTRQSRPKRHIVVNDVPQQEMKWYARA